jgi:hypothetical protein
MTTYTHHSAYVRVEDLPSGVTLLTYGGVMRAPVFAKLRDLALKDLGRACAILVDMRAVLMAGRVDVSGLEGVYLGAPNPPGAVLVAESQIEVWSEYALHASLQGVTRALFTSPGKASAWAANQAAVWVAHLAGASKTRCLSGS